MNVLHRSYFTVIKCIVIFLFFCLVANSLHAEQFTGNPMLPETYSGQDVDEQWLWSEKLDGIRGEWTGSEMLSKQGNPIDVPPYFTENFPPFPLSGEIWGGRQTFERTLSIVSTSGEDKGWNTLQFGIFDSPHPELSIEKRLERATAWFAQHPSKFAFVIRQQPLISKENLHSLLAKIEEGGGEGIVLVRKGSKYRGGRSVDVLKVKNFSDTEAVVVGYHPGKGKNEGRMGSLIVELLKDRSIRFKIGTGLSDKQRNNPPPVGAIVTFKYSGFYSSGKPKFPSFLRVRSITGSIM